MYEDYIANYFKVSKHKQGNVSVPCPFHEDNNPSAGLNFNKKVFNCFKCGGLSFQKLYIKLNRISRITKNEKPRMKKKRKITPELDWGIEEFEEKKNEYLIERGLDPENLPIECVVCNDYRDDEGKLFRYYGYLIFESVNGLLCARDLLNFDDLPQRPKYLHEPGEKDLFWLAKDEANKVVFLVEGIFDGLTLLECSSGIKNVAIVGGSNITKDNIIYTLKDNTVVVLFDNDAAGFKGGKQISSKLKEFDIDHTVVELPKIFGKDLNEGLVNEKERLELWINKLVDRFSPDDINYTYRLFHSKNGIEALNVLPTGIAEVDEYLTGGFKDGGHIISGTTGVGKTSLIFDVSINGVLNHNKRIMINSCEISKRQSWARIASQFSEYTWEELEEDPKLLEPSAFKKVERIAKDLIVVNGWPLKRILQEAKDYDVIIIDYIQRVREAYGAEESATRHLINNYVSQLTDLGALQGKICIMVSSLGRASYDKPNDYGLKESGSIEYMGASVNRLSSIGDPMSGNFMWRIQKNTRGNTGIIRLKGVDLGHSSFRNATTEPVEV